jgi:hypothetical protein
MALTALHRFGPEDLNPEEFIIYRARLSFVAFLLSLKLWVLMMLLAFFVLVSAYWYRTSVGFFIDPTITLGISLVFLLLFLPGAYRFSVRLIDWLYDEDVITNQRVIDYNQKFLFSKDLTTANMRSVEDIILTQNGFIQTFFNYGDLSVQTSGLRNAPEEFSRYLILSHISRPKQVQRLIDEVAHRVKKEVVIDKDEVLKLCGLG